MLAWLRRRWQENVSYEGGLSLVYMDGLLLVPFAMAAFFYPLEALLGAAALLVVTFAVYESCVIWRKRHPAHSDAVKLPPSGQSAWWRTLPY